MTGIDRLVRLTLCGAGFGWAVYLLWYFTRASWLVWCELPAGIVVTVCSVPLILAARRVASVGPIATAGILGTLAIATVSWLVGGIHGVSSLHQAELGVLATCLELPWLLIFGLRLRHAAVGRAALAGLVLTVVGTAMLPLRPSAAVAWPVALAGFAAYAVWLLQLPGAVSRIEPAPRLGGGRLWFVPGAPRRGWIVAQAMWLLLAAAFLALAVDLPGDRLGALVVTCLLWLAGAWLMAAASVALRAVRRSREARIARP